MVLPKTWDEKGYRERYDETVMRAGFVKSYERGTGVLASHYVEPREKISLFRDCYEIVKNACKVNVPKWILHDFALYMQASIQMKITAQWQPELLNHLQELS